MTLFSSPPAGTSADVMFGISSRTPRKPSFDRRQARASSRRDLVAERATLGDQLVGRFPSARFRFATSCALALRARLPLVRRLNERATLTSSVCAAIDDRRERRRARHVGACLAEQIELLAKDTKVVHELVLWNAGRERAEAAVRIDGVRDGHRAFAARLTARTTSLAYSVLTRERYAADVRVGALNRDDLVDAHHHRRVGAIARLGRRRQRRRSLSPTV